MLACDLNKPQFCVDGRFISRQKEYGKGFGVGFGLGAGWSHWLSEKWVLDISFAFDKIYSWYNRYGRNGDIVMVPKGHENYKKPDPFNGSVEEFPIKLGVSFGYRIFTPKTREAR
jgi:hypothetical protein